MIGMVGHLGVPPSTAPDDDDDNAAPSELLEPLLEKWPDLLGLVLAHLDSTDCALLAQVVGWQTLLATPPYIFHSRTDFLGLKSVKGAAHVRVVVADRQEEHLR